MPDKFTAPETRDQPPPKFRDPVQAEDGMRPPLAKRLSRPAQQFDFRFGRGQVAEIVIIPCEPDPKRHRERQEEYAQCHQPWSKTSVPGVEKNLPRDRGDYDQWQRKIARLSKTSRGDCQAGPRRDNNARALALQQFSESEECDAEAKWRESVALNRIKRALRPDRQQHRDAELQKLIVRECRSCSGEADPDQSRRDADV